MNERLQNLLKLIQLEEKYYNLFSMAQLKSVRFVEKSKRVFIIIETEEVLPSISYFHVQDLLRKQFESNEVYLKIEPKKIDYKLLPDYYIKTVSKITKKKPIVEIFKDALVFDDKENKYYLEVSNQNQKNLAEEILQVINGNGSLYGFDTKIKVRVCEKRAKELKDVVKKSKNIKVDESILKPKASSKKYNTVRNSNVVLGRSFKGDVDPIKSLIGEYNNVVIQGELFGVDFFESPKTDFKIITLKVTDYTDSIFVKVFLRDKDEYERLQKEFKVGNSYLIRGSSKDDQYAKELVINARDIIKVDTVNEVIKDDAKEKRVELHAHTTMSQMDGLITPKNLINHAIFLGHNAVAVTDHNGVQAFPDIYNTVKYHNMKIKDDKDKFKAIYGAELTMIDDSVDIILRGTNELLDDVTYIVFDLETTGFNAAGSDVIIEIGAVKLKNNEIIDTFNMLIDPKVKLDPLITNITGITDDMLKGQADEKDAIKKFKEFAGDDTLVAHNAKFDTSFLEASYNKYDLGELTNPILDTLKLSQTLDNNYARHSLSVIVKRYDVEFDEDKHHRADYDAEKTALVLVKMLKKLKDNNYKTLNDLNNLVSKEEIHKYGVSHHINILVKNKEGLKNLFKIISLATTKYLYRFPRILRSEIEKHREGLLIGSGCYESEIFKGARTLSDEELSDAISFYDYVEIQPRDAYDHLIQAKEITKVELEELLKKIVRLTQKTGKTIIGTGDVHHLRKEDKVFREIIVNQKVPGGGLHPLNKRNITEIPSMHFRTTNEMLEDFSFLGKDLAYKLVVENPNNMIKDIPILEVIIETNGVPFSPKIKDSDKIVKDMVYKNAHEIYGEKLHPIIDVRIKEELEGIIGAGYDVIYLISQKLVKQSNDEGYLVGSRGSVGSSLVATMMEITEVNPLPAHYVCPSCKHTEFEDENKNSYSITYSSGYDLEDKNCPKCSTLMTKDGQDMPFATFLGFNADKVPDIDLNFSGDYQVKAHEQTKQMFGEDYVFRAGTVGTVAEKTAYGFVKGYLEDNGILNTRRAEIERLAQGCIGVKRTTGQHPGGLVVVPNDMEIYDFTPYQYPADDDKSIWKTTHFDYHSLEDNLLKLDILGHDDPTMLKMLGDLSGLDVTKLPTDDKRVYSILSSPKELGVTKEQILCPTGTLGVPELGTKFVIAMLDETKPKTFAELVKISGLSHGTDVWAGNAQELIKNKVVEFKDVIGCRDDIMVNLINYGLEPIEAFKIMEFVRRGKPTREPDVWAPMASMMREHKVPEWYIESCRRIKYMFPKAHASAYVLSAIRIAWFKVYKPHMYYTAYFSIRANDFDVDSMIAGYDKLKEEVTNLELKGYEITNKEQAVLDTVRIALEATARGITFANIDINKSLAKEFVILDENTLLPSFMTIDGLGENAAKTIVKEREKRPFISIEDLQKRGRVNNTVIDKMRMMGILDDLPESSQMTLF